MMRTSSRVGPDALDALERTTAAESSMASMTSSSDPCQVMNVFAVERCDEGAVKALDDLVGQEVALARPP